MYRIILIVLAAFATPGPFLFAQGNILETLHGPDETWFVTDATGGTVDLVADMQPGQVLLVLPVDRNGEDFLGELGPFEEILDVLGENGTQELSIALVEISGHNLASDSWASGTTIPVYSSQSATLSALQYESDYDQTYTTIQKLSDGSFIEAWRFFDLNNSYNGWWTHPLSSILYHGRQPYNLDFTEESFLTLNAGFPAFDESWCAAVGCEVEDFTGYVLGAGASESNPDLWHAYGGLIGTSQDGTIVQDPTDPNNKVLELKTDSINGDVGFVNKHLHVFGDYEIEFDMMRREDKGGSFIGFTGEFGFPETQVGDGLGYTGYFGNFGSTEDGETATYWYELRGLDVAFDDEVWHHIKIGFSKTYNRGFYIEIDGEIVWSPPTNYSYVTKPKFSAFNFYARTGMEAEFLIDNVLITPRYPRNVADFEGCTNPNACNYNQLANSLGESFCQFPELGHDCNGECIQDSNNDGVCDGVVGCIDPFHPLYDPTATIAEDCCTVYEDASAYYADLNKASRLLRQSAWSLSRVIVTDSLESVVWFDTQDGGIEEYEADDLWTFQQEDVNNTLFTGTNGHLEYDNRYVSRLFSEGSFSPEYGVYRMPDWYIAQSCGDELGIPYEDAIILSADARFTPDVEYSFSNYDSRPAFLGWTDAIGYNPGCDGYGSRFLIRTINDSVLTVKSPLTSEGAYALITFDAQPHEFPFCVLGCTEPGACNYEAHATYDDGTCTYLCAAGCTDESALNFDTDAVIDDGSCAYFCGFASVEDITYALESFTEPGLLFGGATHVDLGAGVVAHNSIVVPQNYQNTAGGAFPIASFTPTSISGLPPGLQATTFPVNLALPGGAAECLSVEGTPEAMGVYNVAVEGDLSVFFGTLEQDFGSFTYNWVIVVNEGQDPILGCTYPDASNFVSYANDDDGSCVFDASPELCPADFDGNGQVGTPDLLDFLSYFGAICD